MPRAPWGFAETSCLWAHVRARGRSCRSRGGTFWSCLSWCSSSLSVASCHGSITSPVFSFLSRLLLSFPLLPHLTFARSKSTEKVRSLLYHWWPTLDSFPPLFGFMFIRLTGTCWSSSRVCLSQAPSVQTRIYTACLQVTWRRPARLDPFSQLLPLVLFS